MHKLGSEIRVGDTIKNLWWQPVGSVLLKMRPYNGRLLDLFPNGASIGTFTSENNRSGKCEMTVDHGDYFEVA